MVRFQRLSTVDLEAPLISAKKSPEASQNAFNQCRSSFVPVQLIVGSILLLAGFAVWALSSFTWCDDVTECYDMNRMSSSNYHLYGVFVIAPLLLAELVNLVISFNEAHEPHVAMLSLPSRWQASLLMCVAFSILLLAEIASAPGERFVHAVDQEGAMEQWRPVYTMRYIEWCVNVPLLLIISGHFCLGRPMSEVAGPLFLTDVYIFLSWEAFVVSSVFLSWTLVVISFALYAWASYEMLLWARNFLQLPAGKFPARRLRAAMIVGIVVIFGVYGVIYLLAITGVIEASVEQACYTIGDVGVKTTFCIVLTAIRSMDSRHVLAISFQHITSQNDILMSLLRGSFDIVMKCTLDSDGNCWLPDSSSCDLRKLEHWLNRPAAGCALNQLLDGPDQQKRFHSYVLGAVQRTEFSAVSEQGVAQVINCDLVSMLGHGGVTQRQTAVLHLSGVSSVSMGDLGRTAFIAVCMSSGDEEVQYSDAQGDCPTRHVSQNTGVGSLGSLSLSEWSRGGDDYVSESDRPRSEVSFTSFAFSQGTLRSRNALSKVPERDLETSLGESANGEEDRIHMCVQTDPPQVGVSKSVQTVSSSRRLAVASSRSRPPIDPGHPSKYDSYDGHGGATASESRQNGAPDAEGTSPQERELSQDEKMVRWKERREKKKAQLKGGRFSSGEGKKSYGAQVRHEMDIQAGRISADEGYSSNRSCCSFSSRCSYHSGSESGLPAEPAHVVTNRSPRGSQWHLQEENSCDTSHRSWVSPKEELPTAQGVNIV